MQHLQTLRFESPLTVFRMYLLLQPALTPAPHLVPPTPAALMVVVALALAPLATPATAAPRLASRHVRTYRI